MDITGIGSAVSSVANAATAIANKFWPDKTEEEKMQYAKEMQEIMNEHNLQVSQIDVNKTEASSPNWFVAGWRPATGWICALSFGYASIIAPLFHFSMPDTSLMTDVLFGMLGLGGLRSYEKQKGVESNR